MELLYANADLDQAFCLVCGFFTTMAVIASYVLMIR